MPGIGSPWTVKVPDDAEPGDIVVVDEDGEFSTAPPEGGSLPDFTETEDGDVLTIAEGEPAWAPPSAPSTPWLQATLNSNYSIDGAVNYREKDGVLELAVYGLTPEANASGDEIARAVDFFDGVGPAIFGSQTLDLRTGQGYEDGECWVYRDANDLVMSLNFSPTSSSSTFRFGWSIPLGPPEGV